LDSFLKGKYLPGIWKILWGPSGPKEQKRRGEFKRAFGTILLSSIKSPGHKWVFGSNFKNGAFSNVSDLCNMF
jgi:hypothetical protein